MASIIQLRHRQTTRKRESLWSLSSVSNSWASCQLKSQSLVLLLCRRRWNMLKGNETTQHKFLYQLVIVCFEWIRFNFGFNDHKFASRFAPRVARSDESTKMINWILPLSWLWSSVNPELKFLFYADDMEANWSQKVSVHLLIFMTM